MLGRLNRYVVGSGKHPCESIATVSLGYILINLRSRMVLQGNSDIGHGFGVRSIDSPFHLIDCLCTGDMSSRKQTGRDTKSQDDSVIHMSLSAFERTSLCCQRLLNSGVISIFLYERRL